MSVKNARAFRKRSTDAGKLLWSRLRNRQVQGLKFRREHPIGDRVVDFFCAEAQLAIELDGSGHGRHLNQVADPERELELHEKSVRLIRFWNREVTDNLDGVVNAIIYAIDPEKSLWPPSSTGPHPNPLPVGQGIEASRNTLV